MFHYHHGLVLEAAKYKMLADYFKYTNPQLHIMYEQKHLICVQQLAQAELQAYHYSVMSRAGEPNAFIRLFHASPEASGVDVYVNGNKSITNLVFEETTDYLSLPPGRYILEVYPTGETTSPILKDQISLTSNTYYTAAVLGLLNHMTFTFFIDKPYVSRNHVKIRFIHLSPNVSNVDIAVQGGNILFQNVSYGRVTDYLTLSPMNVDLEMRETGTNNVVLTIPQVQLNAGETYTAIAVGLVGRTPELEVIFLMP